MKHIVNMPKSLDTEDLKLVEQLHLEGTRAYQSEDWAVLDLIDEATNTIFKLARKLDKS